MSEIVERGQEWERRTGESVIYAQVYVTGLVEETFTVMCPFSERLPKEDVARMAPQIIKDAIEDLFARKPPEWKTTDARSSSLREPLTTEEK